MDPNIKIKSEDEEEEECIIKTENFDEITIKEEPITSTTSKEVTTKKTKPTFTNEQKIVAATWWHEKHFNRQSTDDIKRNFMVRFRMNCPKKQTLIYWEKILFSKGKVTSDKREKDEESDEGKSGETEDSEDISEIDEMMSDSEGDMSD